MNLRHLSNHQLDLETKRVAEEERGAMLVVLWHLWENDRRQLYAERGHKDLKTYCVKELKMSEGSAWRRISAMKLLREIPETEGKLQSGELNLSQVCQAQVFFRQVLSTQEEKKEILASLHNQSKKGTERILAEKGFEEEPKIKERAIRGGKVEVTLVLDEELLKQMEEIEILLGKKMTKLELVRLMTKHMLESLKRVPNARRNHRRRRSASVSRVTLREVRARDEHRCQYQDPETGQRCDARHGLQIEHKIPRAKGGLNTVDNLELLCANHNRLRAVQQFGREKMKNYLRSLE